ncbi:AAA domain-containing protein [Actinoplanes sp. N902-109]|uniref:AAA domain-containing protein n=1 Tax=Actinoplanes sp. (strain N902-109) TaxID=649831 RepID=UPI00032941DB|nr:AAA domain-containing protein [Actinoplanes sp. N902-109]AGL19256.1 protein kinase [Actinoplanes sp. N902-109]
MTPDQLVQLIDETFCGADAVYGPYHQLGGGVLRPPRTVVEDCLYEFSLADSRNQAVTLQVFQGINQLGGMMWQQVVRVLMRAATSGHPSLPVIQEGGFLEASPGSPPDHGFAFVLTEHLESILNEDDPAAGFGLTDQPMTALRQFHLIADGLAALHRMGIIHRNLWPGAVTWRPDGDESFQLGLSGFEMSTLIANMLGTGTLDAALARNTARQIYGGGSRAWPYMPPERMDMLYGDGPMAFVETEFSDVYSLGVLVSEWFLGALPVWETGPPSRRQTEVFREMLRKELANSPLPIALRELLTAMIELDPDHRLAAGEVVATISSQFEAISAIWDPANQGTRPFLLLIKTHDAAARELFNWQWIKTDPATEEGADELAARVGEDLTSGRILHAPHGADPYFSSGAVDRKREAVHLILGKRAAWFCRIYAQSLPSGASPPMPQILEVRFVLNLDSARGRAVLELENHSGASRPTRAIEVIAATPTAPHRSELEEMCKGRPSWKPVLEAVATKTQRSTEEMIASQAFDWLLEYLGVELQAQQYPYVVVENSRNGDTVTLRWDREADRERLNMHPMLAKYAADPRRRPDFGKFFGVTDPGENENNDVEAVDWRPARGAWGDRIERCTVVSSPQGADEIKVRAPSSIPVRGVLRPAGQIGTRMLLDRQAEAKTELLDNRLLLRQLSRPTPIPGRPVDVSAHTADMIGDSPRVISDMLQSDPFFALQGPPGTGKTEIAARAINLHLANNLNHRILISAQSNYALDNLAQRVLSSKGLLVEGVPIDDPNNIAMRVSTTSGERRNKVDSQIQGFTLAELVVRRQDSMVEHADKAIRTAATPALRDLLVEWKQVVERAGPELSDRLHRGANIVFATCATATPRLLNAPTSTAAFDWVIVEEAAKAWPTELAIPLVRGVRWTLIGDHNQLGAHRERETLEFLEECSEDEQPELNAYRDKVQDFSRYLMLVRGPLRRPREGRA